MDRVGVSPMPGHPLFYLINNPAQSNLREQVQISLAIADADQLRSLLEYCIPLIADTRLVGSISVELCVPTGDQQVADGVIRFNLIQCVLAAQEPTPDLSSNGGWTRDSRQMAKMTQHEAELQTLVQNMALAPLVSLLAVSGFSSKQIEAILSLPRDAWHKSWWYAIDQAGDFSQPFLRQIRTLRHSDGTFTVQYRDFFEQNRPTCFTSLPQSVLLAIRPDHQTFGETLRYINYQRQALNISQVVLICNIISELEAEGFMHQGISIYPSRDLILPIQANCIHCSRQDCPMNGLINSPVARCFGFLPQEENSH